MIFAETKLRDVFIIEPERLQDDRGFFARTFCQEEFRAHGLKTEFSQCSVSYNAKKGTLRGMHYQTAPYEEAKLVRCTRGAIYDVAFDLRPGSSTLRQWAAAELTAGNRRMLYVPEGCAHGFQTLEDETEVFYQISTPFHPESARGLRWNDPAFAIDWPLPNPILSKRDGSLPEISLGGGARLRT
ncbi:MAG: dTDP-4-dehydrorhamnose 3,5-epimerase [Acidobacteriota bacterium]|nr:dTDP-4-dehydrorhamnose 3,5-epimerase [Acidobacteriota bacterium]